MTRDMLVFCPSRWRERAVITKNSTSSGATAFRAPTNKSPSSLWNRQPQHDADDQTAQDSEHQTALIPLF